MANDNQNNPAEDKQPEIAPSTLFLEMMRRAAREAESDEPVRTTPSYETEELADAADFEEVDSLAEQDDINFIAKNDEEIIAPVLAVSKPVSENFDSRVPIYEPPAANPDVRQARLEAQRVHRIRRRRERQFRQRVGIVGGFFRTIFVAVFASALASTIFMWFIDAKSIAPTVGSQLQADDSSDPVVMLQEIVPSPPVTPNYLRRVGIIAGHHGPENDPGAVCSDGLIEADINFNVAQLVVKNLRERGFSVDLLDEFDPRLKDYRVAALVSIHSNDCSEYEGGASAYLVARAAARPAGGTDDILAECISSYYQAITQIERRFSLTLDMTDYHTFREIHPLTPAAIIELGFMRDDRLLLTEHQDGLAQGITNGILCFLNGENPMTQATATPIPLDTPENNGG
jgi:N-acetylmuramoyl-L-alanine amidase